MDEPFHVIGAARTTLAGAVGRYLSFHVDDPLVHVKPVMERIPDLAELLKQDHEGVFEKLRRSEGTGRPIGPEDFVVGLEKLLKSIRQSIPTVDKCGCLAAQVPGVNSAMR
jgi:hypothetical protein